MAEVTYAFIKDAEVINVAVFEDPTDAQLLEHFKNEFSLDNIVLATDKAAMGGTYDGVNFLPPQPYPSWIFNEELSDWEPPVQYPTSSKAPEKYFRYVWDEATLSWIEF